jgi:signal peptidase I
MIKTTTHHFGKSMFPLLQNKDLLEVDKTSNISIGDIVLFSDKENETWIAHRVIKIQNNCMYTKGDNNQKQDDGYINKEKVLGVVTACWRNGKCIRIYRGNAGIVQYRVYKNYMHIRKNMAQIFRKFSLPVLLKQRLRQILPVPKEAVFFKNGTEKKILYIGKIPIGTYSDHHQQWQIRFPWYVLYA